MRHRSSARSSRWWRSAEHLDELLADLPTRRPRPAAPPSCASRSTTSGRSAGLGLAYEEDSDRVVLMLRGADRRRRPTTRTMLAEALAAAEGARARCAITRSQAAAFIATAEDLVQGGRRRPRGGLSPRPLCGRARTAAARTDGHPCPRDERAADRSRAGRRRRRTRPPALRRGRGRGPHALELQRHLPRRRSRDGRRRGAAPSTSRDRGERPLWDFPPASTVARWRPASCREALGWRLVPPTVSPRRARSARARCSSSSTPTSTQHYFTLLEERRRPARRSCRTMCAFDLIANNTDRKSGHCLLDPDGQVWAIDNGLCFHAEFKLRTVIWEFAGEPIPEHLLDDVAGLLDRGLPDGLRRPARPLRARRGAAPGPGACWPRPSSRSTTPAAATPGRSSDRRLTVTV